MRDTYFEVANADKTLILDDSFQNYYLDRVITMPNTKDIWERWNDGETSIFTGFEYARHKINFGNELAGLALKSLNGASVSVELTTFRGEGSGPGEFYVLRILAEPNEVKKIKELTFYIFSVKKISPKPHGEGLEVLDHFGNVVYNSEKSYLSVQRCLTRGEDSDLQQVGVPYGCESVIVPLGATHGFGFGGLDPTKGKFYYYDLMTTFSLDKERNKVLYFRYFKRGSFESYDPFMPAWEICTNCYNMIIGYVRKGGS